MREIPKTAIATVKYWESFVPVAYKPIPTDPWTVGYGFTVGVCEGDTITKDEAHARLMDELEDLGRSISKACAIYPNDNQFSAMLSLAFNIGINGFLKSTVLRAHNKGDFESAARAFGLWVKSKGKVINGLVARRASEASLYLKDVKCEPDVKVPHTSTTSSSVDNEKPLTHSSTINAGTLTATASGLSIASQMAGDIASIKYMLGDWMPYIVLGCAVVAAVCGVYVVFERYRNRQRGLL